jgi:hypothetical protein
MPDMLDITGGSKIPASLKDAAARLTGQASAGLDWFSIFF